MRYDVLKYFQDLLSKARFDALLQDTRYKIQDTGYRIQDTGYRMQDTGCRMQDTGYRMQDTGYKIQDAGYRMGGAQRDLVAGNAGCNDESGKFVNKLNVD